jgi:microcystin-dependent protein
MKKLTALLAGMIALALVASAEPVLAEVYDWSQTPATNSTSDSGSDIQWAEGMAPSDVNDSARAMMAEMRKFIDDLGAYATTNTVQTTGGTSTAYTLTTEGSADSLENGRIVCAVFNTSNGATPTLNVDSLGAKSIFVDASNAVPTNYFAANTLHCLSYNAAANTAAGAWIVRGYQPITTSLEYNSSGQLQRSALTGDVTASAGSNATTIPNDTVTFAKMANISATDRFIGRDTSGSGDAEEITVTNAYLMIHGADPGVDSISFWDDSDGAPDYLAVDSTLTISGNTLSRAALTGDVTTSTNAATIANDAVTYAKMQNVSATDRFLGRDTAAAGDVEEITGTNAFIIINGADPGADRISFWDDSDGAPDYLAVDSTLTISGNTLSRAALTGDVTTSTNAATIANDAVTSAKISADTIAAGDIATSGVTTDEILDGTIATADLADGSVTAGKLAGSISAGTTRVGMVIDFVSSTCPTQYVAAYGQAISRSTYSELFALTGTTYGVGDGSTTFNVPDLRGRVVVGEDDMGGVSADRIATTLNGDTLGATGGEELHTMTSGELVAHTHTQQGSFSSGNNSVSHTHDWGDTTSSNGSHSHDNNSDANSGSVNVASGNQTSVADGGGTAETGTDGSHTHSVGGTTDVNSVSHTHSTTISGETASTGSTTPFNVVQPSMVMTKCIYAGA